MTENTKPLQSTQILARNRLLLGQLLIELQGLFEDGRKVSVQADEILREIRTRIGIGNGLVFALKELLTPEAFAEQMRLAELNETEINECLTNATK